MIQLLVTIVLYAFAGCPDYEAQHQARAKARHAQHDAGVTP